MSVCVGRSVRALHSDLRFVKGGPHCETVYYENAAVNISFYKLISLQDAHSFPKPDPKLILWTTLHFPETSFCKPLLKSVFDEKLLKQKFIFVILKNELTHVCFFSFEFFVSAH